MVAKQAEELVKSLGQPGSDACSRSLRALKNSIIGDKNKKAGLPSVASRPAREGGARSYRALHGAREQVVFVKAGAVPKVVRILEESLGSDDRELVIQALATLGSFTYNSDVGLRAVVESGVLAQVLSDRLLGSPDLRVVESACRCLKMIFSSDKAPRSIIFEEQMLKRRGAPDSPPRRCEMARPPPGS